MQYLSREAFRLPTVIIGSVSYSRIFSTMREVKVKGVSGFCSLDSGGESHILQSESASESHRHSSLNVQFTPEIEKKMWKWKVLPDCFFIGCDISASLIKICADRGHEVLVANAVDLPYITGFGDAAISIAVLHHLSTESRRTKAIEELIRVVKKGGLVLITIWAVEQEDKSLVAKWTSLSQKYGEEWIGPGSPRVRSPSSRTLQSIPETEENGLGERNKDFRQSSMQNFRETTSQSENYSGDSGVVKDANDQQEYFVPWHLPYHSCKWPCK